jgi:tRNA nucleotidyltransferase (CCA-adding enzyme)
MENLSQLMRERLPAGVADLLVRVGELSEARQQRMCLVGGAVRDLLMGRRNLDLDLVAEGDALGLAGELAKLGELSGVVDEGVQGKVTLHRRFGTAKFRWGDLTVDLAMARSETYARPGALPTVQPGAIEDDLRRRDFTINAMAVFLTPTSFGQLLDPHGGREDIDRGLVRILHEGSFIDDATRMLRAVRYEQRLAFKLEENTERLLRENMSMLDAISGSRIKRELELILSEECPERMLQRAQGLGILRQLAPSIAIDDCMVERFQQAREQQQSDPMVYMLLLIYRLEEDDIENFITRLDVTGQWAKAMRQIPRLKNDMPYLDNQDLSPSAICRLLQPYFIESLIAGMLACESEVGRSNVERYLNQLRYVNPSLEGSDLQRLGVPSGPRMGRMLETLRDAKLDGQVVTKEEEETLVRRLLGGN